MPQMNTNPEPVNARAPGNFGRRETGLRAVLRGFPTQDRASSPDGPPQPVPSRLRWLRGVALAFLLLALISGTWAYLLLGSR